MLISHTVLRFGESNAVLWASVWEGMEGDEVRTAQELLAYVSGGGWWWVVLSGRVGG